MAQSRLTEKEEKLLEKYFDGESRFFEKSKAKRLLDEKPEALAYIQTLKLLSSETEKVVSTAYSSNVDLWDRISNRIDQEEYAAIFLGERKVAKEEKTPWYSGIGWAIPGAALSALAFFVVSSTQQLNPELDSLPLGSPAPLGFAQGSQEISAFPVSSNSLNTRKSQPSKHASNFVRHQASALSNVVEVDWMRSDGRVRLIHDPEDTGAIIWVRRRNQALKGTSSIAGARNSNGIEVIDEQIPETLVIGAK